MRVISGTHKSRQFHISQNLKIRPTTDFAKEALFNILQHRNLLAHPKSPSVPTRAGFPKGRTLNTKSSAQVGVNTPTKHFSLPFRGRWRGLLFSDEKEEGIMALDLFSGSGSISYEFASRGCHEIIAVEKNRSCCGFIKKTAAEFNFSNIHVINMDVFVYLKSSADVFDIIFADPPFKLKNIERIPTLIFEKNLLKENGLLIVEHSSEVNFAEQEQFLEKREYGTVNFSIFTSPRT